MPRRAKRSAKRNADSPGSASSSSSSSSSAAPPRPKRPRRSRAARGEATYLNADDGTLQFVDCPPYFPPTAQPFRVTVSTAAAATVDLHAHFTMHEVIGYLAGRWDASGRVLKIVRAFPGVSTSCDHDSQNALQEAEMDPVAEVALRDEVRAAGLTIVGWYHSHPGYGCWLSGTDVATQLTNQQHQDPWLAVVVSAPQCPVLFTRA